MQLVALGSKPQKRNRYGLAMTHAAAAVFAQVLSMLFIASFLQFRRFKVMESFALITLIAVTLSVFAMFYLLASVALEEPMTEMGNVFAWGAITIHLLTIAASALHEYIRADKNPREEADKD